MTGAGVAGDVDQCHQAIHVWHLRDDRRDAPVGDGYGDDVSTGIGGAPHHDPIGIHTVQRARVCDRRRVVLELARGREQLSGLTAA